MFVKYQEYLNVPLLWMDQKKGEPRDWERPSVKRDYWVQLASLD